MYEDEDFYDDEPRLDDSCPACYSDYDEIDYEYQICHKCHYNNSKSFSLTEWNKTETQNDSELPR